MSYRNRIAQLEQEIDDRSALWEKSKPFQPYVLIAVSLLVLLLTLTPKWLYKRNPITRQKKLNVAKLIGVWVALATVGCAAYYVYLKRFSKGWK